MSVVASKIRKVLWCVVSVHQFVTVTAQTLQRVRHIIEQRYALDPQMRDC